MMKDDVEIKFQRFFTVNFPKVKNFALMLLKSESDSEDVAQDVFLKLWQQPDLWLDKEVTMDGYLFVMTKNMILNIFKHQRVAQEYEEDVIDKGLLSELTGEEEALTDVYYEEMLMLVRLTLEKMPKKRKLIFEMSRFKGFSNKEIADKLDLSVRTVDHQIYLSLIELKKVLLFFIFFLHTF